MINKKQPNFILSVRMRSVSLAIAVALSTPSVHAALVAKGSAFQVNATAISFPNVGGAVRAAVASDGHFAIAWSAIEGSDASLNIYVRQFASDGTPLGPEFMANSTPASSGAEQKLAPAIAMDAAGDFVVGWSTAVPTATGNVFNYRARMFNADGTPLGVDFCVDANCPAGSGALALAMDNAGDWVASWNELPEGQIGIDGMGTIKVRRFNKDGTPKDASPVVVASAKGDGEPPSLTINKNSGDFAVAWWNGIYLATAAWFESAHESIQLRRFAANGSPVGDTVSVAACSVLDTTFAPSLGCWLQGPLVTSDDTGTLTVQWQWVTSNTIKLYAARLQAGASKPDKKFTIMKEAQGDSLVLSAAAEDGAGKFVSVWQNEVTVFGQAVAANNRLDGSSIQLQLSPPGQYLNEAGFSMNDADDAVAVWAQFANDAATINAQRYSVE